MIDWLVDFGGSLLVAAMTIVAILATGIAVNVLFDVLVRLVEWDRARTRRARLPIAPAVIDRAYPYLPRRCAARAPAKPSRSVAEDRRWN